MLPLSLFEVAISYVESRAGQDPGISESERSDASVDSPMIIAMESSCSVCCNGLQTDPGTRIDIVNQVIGFLKITRGGTYLYPGFHHKTGAAD